MPDQVSVRAELHRPCLIEAGIDGAERRKTAGLTNAPCVTNDLTLLRGPLKPAPADERGSDSDDPVGSSVGPPGLHGQLSGPIQLGRFGDDSRHALDKNAPPA